MQVDGWDIPVSASNYYRSKWHHILGKQPYKTLPEWIAFAEKLAGKYGGVLPSGGRLQKFQDGYALYQRMKKYPMAFSHIPTTAVEVRVTIPKPIGLHEQRKSQTTTEDDYPTIYKNLIHPYMLKCEPIQSCFLIYTRTQKNARQQDADFLVRLLTSGVESPTI